jgi:hypothetical protein
MAETKQFDEYVRVRLMEWGVVFPLWDRYEKLGAGKHMLQRLIEHRGEIPPPNIGFKPLTISLDAMQVEDIVQALHREHPEAANVLRVAYTVGYGSAVERIRMVAYILGHKITRRQYYALKDIAFHRVAGALMKSARAA